MTPTEVREYQRETLRLYRADQTQDGEYEARWAAARQACDRADTCECCCDECPCQSDTEEETP